MSDGRLPAHLEVSALIRATEAAGGFATVVQKGERDSGSILLVTGERGDRTQLWERMPRLDGRRAFEVVRSQAAEIRAGFADYVTRRMERDRDAWVIELDIAEPERLIAQFAP